MLVAVIMGRSRSGPGRFSMRSRALRLRSLRILRLRSRVFLRSRRWFARPLRFEDFLGIVGVTRKPLLYWNREDVFEPQLFQILWGFSRFLSHFHQNN